MSNLLRGAGASGLGNREMQFVRRYWFTELTHLHLKAFQFGLGICTHHGHRYIVAWSRSLDNKLYSRKMLLETDTLIYTIFCLSVHIYQSLHQFYQQVKLLRGATHLYDAIIDQLHVYPGDFSLDPLHVLAF